MKAKFRKILAVILAVAVMIPAFSVTKTAKAASSVSLANLGSLGTLKVGSKTKTGSWWKMRIGGTAAFCIDLGATCHTGDVYQSASDTYKSTDGGARAKKAYVAYWYDEAMKNSNKAWVMSQALLWGLQEGETSESELKAVIKTVKSNTGYFSSKTANELYEDIFEVSGTVTANVKEWKYTGSGSKRQRLLQFDASITPQYKIMSYSDRYRQRIKLVKTYGADGEEQKPLAGATFKLECHNIDEMYFAGAYGAGSTEQDEDDLKDKEDFEYTTKTNAKGRIDYKFTYEVSSDEYAYYSAEDLAKMDADALAEAKKQIKEDGYKYGEDLDYNSARQKAETEVQKQIHDKIKNKYTITEISSGNNAILVNPEYAKGKTITLDGSHSYIRMNGEWPDKQDGKDYALAYEVNVNNEWKMASVKVVKKNKNTADGKTRGDAVLDGAAFRIYQDSACTKEADIFDSKGKPVENYYTTENGAFTTGFLKADTTYYLKEEKAPTGYLPLEKPVTFKVDGKDLTLHYNPTAETVEVEEPIIRNTVSIVKTMSNGETGISDYEVGATFQIYLSDKESYENANPDMERDTIVTDKKGYACTKPLAYGTYTVHQVNSGENDTERVEDFPVIINEDSSNREPYEYLLNNHPFESYLRIIKKDDNTEKTVLKENTTYKIYKVDSDTGKEIQVIQSYSDGKKIVKLEEYKTDENGVVMTGQPLESGTYRIYEIDVASGYFLNSKPLEVTIGSTMDNYTIEDDGNGKVYTITQAEYFNKESYGKLVVEKSGDQLEAFENGKFIYKESKLQNVMFEIYAAEDIVTQDNQGDTWFSKGELVGTFTTGAGATFTSECGGITGYDMKEDGSLILKLPLGKYEIKEKSTVHGYVLSEKPWTVEFTWENKDEEQVLDCSGTTDGHGVLSINNQLAKPEVTVIKKDDTTKENVAGAEFGLYTKHDIYNSSGEVIVPADTLIETVITDKEGKAVVQNQLPIMSQDYNKEGADYQNSGDYYFKELKISDSYYIEQTPLNVHLEYVNQNTAVIPVLVTKSNRQTEIEVDKLTLAGSKELPGCSLQIMDGNGNVIIKWTSGKEDSSVICKGAEKLGYRNIKTRLTEKGNLLINGLLHDTEYTLVETKPAAGYATAEDITFRIGGTDEQNIIYIYENGNWKKSTENRVLMYDDSTKILFRKTGGGKDLLAGAKFSVQDSKGKEIYTFTTNSKKEILLESILSVGKTYYFVETEAPEGYNLAAPVKVKIQDTGDIQKVSVDNRKWGSIRTRTPSDFWEKSDTSPKTGYAALMNVLFGTMCMSGTSFVIAKRRKKKYEKK